MKIHATLPRVLQIVSYGGPPGVWSLETSSLKSGVSNLKCSISSAGCGRGQALNLKARERQDRRKQRNVTNEPNAGRYTRRAQIIMRIGVEPRRKAIRALDNVARNAERRPGAGGTSTIGLVGALADPSRASRDTQQAGQHQGATGALADI